MSFKCQMCGLPQPKGVKPKTIIKETRRKTYPPIVDKEGVLIDKGGKGWEIAREVKVCPYCAQ